MNDNTEMADKAEQYIKAGDSVVTIEVIAEVVYVLKGVYSLNRDLIASAVNDFIALIHCQEPEVVKTALETYSTRSLDFVDCVLYGYHKIKGADIVTFDKKLLALLSSSGE